MTANFKTDGAENRLRSVFPRPLPVTIVRRLDRLNQVTANDSHEVAVDQGLIRSMVGAHKSATASAPQRAELQRERLREAVDNSAPCDARRRREAPSRS